MTDNEIIKALECCLSDNPPCYRCKYDADTITVDECMSKLMKDALDLINRQKAEIERLTTEKENLRCVIEDLSNNTEHAKAEAVKEFAERLKEKLQDDCPTITAEEDDFSGYDIFETDEIIDNLVKEMVGEG